MARLFPDCESDMIDLLELIVGENTPRQSQSFGPYIYKVPGELRKQKESAHNPRVVSIGPIHCMDNHVQAMQDVKLKYTADLRSRMVEEMHDFDPDKRCKREVDSLLLHMYGYDFERRVRGCYAEEVAGGHWTFARTMIIDGCFILELLFKSYLIKNKESIEPDPIYCSPLRLLDIRHDLLLLENQIPFFVLQDFFKSAMKFIASKFSSSLTLSQLILSFFGNVMNFEEPYGVLLQTNTRERTHYRHILHLLHNYYVPPYNPRSWGNNLGTPPKFTSSASDLRWTGVKIVPCTAEEPFNVKFNKGQGPLWLYGRPRFEIPPLCIYDETEPFLRNLIAFEQCCPSVPRHFTSYAFLMNTLIGSPEDAQVLPYEAGMHSSNRWPRILATLKRDYFGNPWSGMAVVAAIILFGLAVMQTLYETLSYYQGK